MGNISIIIPTRNRKGLIFQTLEGILSQSYEADEIIVIDDHSTDGSMEYLDKTYGNKIILKRNKGHGPGAARNTGMELATCDYIKFFDSDDIMSPNSLEVQISELKVSGKLCLYTPYIRAIFNGDIWTPYDGTIMHYFPFPSKETLNSWMCRGLFIAIPGMLFKRELLEAVGSWREDIKAYEDWDYLWRIGRMEHYPAHSNECVFLYRQHEKQITELDSTDLERDQDAIDVFSRILQDFPRSNFRDKLFMENKLFRILNKYPKHNYLQKNANRGNQLLNMIFAFYYQFFQKYQRVKSKTHWMAFYGPYDNLDKVSAYMKMFRNG